MYSLEIIYAAEEFRIDAITASDFQHVCTTCCHSAHGPDGFEPAEMQLLSDATFDRIAQLLNLIESGEPWPEGMNTGKMAFLEKENAGGEDSKQKAY